MRTSNLCGPVTVAHPTACGGRLNHVTMTSSLNVNAPLFFPRVRPAATTIEESLNLAVNIIYVFYSNARSIRNNLAELHLKLYCGEFKILCFSETWLSLNFTDGMLDPMSKFNIYRRDRNAQWPAGGVCIFICKSLQSCLCAKTTDNILYANTEIVAANIYLNAKYYITIVCTYLPPNLTQDLFHLSMLHLKDISSLGSPLVLVGDFNMPSIDWTNMISGCDTKSVEFCELCSDNGLIQLVEEPTRLNNILDLVLCNDRTLLAKVEVSAPFGMSDHNSISFSIVPACRNIRNNASPRSFLNWHKTDWKSFLEYCKSIDWPEILQTESSVDELWCAFAAAIKAGIQLYVPICVFRQNSKMSQKIQNKSIRKLKSRKHKLWKRLKKNCSTANKLKYKLAAKNLKLTSVAAQEMNEINLINMNNLGQFYKHVNRHSVHRTGFGPLTNINGDLVVDDQQKADILNSHFVDGCTVDNGVLPPMPVVSDENRSKLESIVFSSHQVRQLLRKTQNKVSSGPDGLPSILYKQLANELCYPLARIFNVIMITGCVPETWKKACVIPVHKKGPASNPKNYRPISLTCVGCKVFESAIKNVLVPFLESKKLLSENQHGFRSKHSTCLNLLESLNNWTENLDCKIDTFVAHVDFARAFDCVSIPKLLHKLEWAGICAPLLTCIRSLLQDRTQQVKIDNCFSSFRSIGSGVPQGSVLGPILFIFYINDLTDEIDNPSVPKLYADDLKAYNSSTSDPLGQNFKSTLANITKWSDKWQLPISADKSKYLIISNKPSNYFFATDLPELAGKNLTRVSDVLDLGVNFNSKLNFSNHISCIATKAKQRLFLLKKIFSSKNVSILILGFKTYVLPILEYCSQVWNPSNLLEIRRLESVQRVFTKKLPGYQGLGYIARLDQAGLCTLELRRLRADLCFCYKILHKLIDTPISNFFQIDNARSTRGHHWKLKSVTPRLECRLNFFSYRIVKPWNSLSEITVNANSTESFCALLRLECLDKFLTIKS